MRTLVFILGVFSFYLLGSYVVWDLYWLKNINELYPGDRFFLILGFTSYMCFFMFIYILYKEH